ncbi:GerAB/ArcD/ProY family transporter [Paenibacillus xylanilyticus]|uniref:GerAB/ArcD/ProY family transporter n=1 Tax=Paenibacillus xylanilyticus TaxID=248903 RepID=UPI00399FB892
MQINNRQLFWLIMSIEIGMNLLLSINFAIQSSKQDVWISMILAGLVSLFIGWICIKVSLLYPDQTLIEFTTTILGKGLGKVVGFFYLAQWYWVIAVMLREEYTFIRLSLLPKTPDYLIVLAMLAVVVYAVYKGGIETIGRLSELWGPILLLILVFTIILTSHNLRVNALLPIYSDSGMFPIMRGALAPTSLLGEVSLVMMLISFTSFSNKADKQRQLSKSILSAVFLSTTFLILGAVWVIMTFGAELAKRIHYPFFEMVKLVYLMEFIQSLEIIMVSIWVISVFIKQSVYLFIASYGSAQWIGRTNGWKKWLWVAAFIIGALAMTIVRLDPSSKTLLEVIWIRFVLPINFLLFPTLLYIVGRLRKRKQEHKASP